MLFTMNSFLYHPLKFSESYIMKCLGSSGVCTLDIYVHMFICGGSTKGSGASDLNRMPNRDTTMRAPWASSANSQGGGALVDFWVTEFCYSICFLVVLN